MAEPFSVAALVVTIMTLAVNLFQSIRENHFKSTCFGCCEVQHDVAMSSNTSPLVAK